MSKERFFSVVAAVLAGACALPAVEIDETLGGSGAGGGGGDTGGGRGGLSGSGGSAGRSGGSGGGVPLDTREDACIDYCDTYFIACAEHDRNTYDNSLDCIQTCGTADWPFGTVTAEVNSVQCRRAHAKLALNDPDPHCDHSAEFPQGASCAP
ncbi:MAG TPA: hypothetical protein VGK73_39075 [Polyangiaceae bacterium]